MISYPNESCDNGVQSNFGKHFKTLKGFCHYKKINDPCNQVVRIKISSKRFTNSDVIIP